MTEDERAKAIEVPYTSLQPATLRAVIDEFVTRDTTDYGERERSLEEKVADVVRQLERGEAKLVFAAETGTVTIVMAQSGLNTTFLAAAVIAFPRSQISDCPMTRCPAIRGCASSAAGLHGSVKIGGQQCRKALPAGTSEHIVRAVETRPPTARRYVPPPSGR